MTIGCPSCGREAGFHAVSCCYDRSTDGLARIRARLTSLYGEVLTWASDAHTPWASQLVDRLRMGLQDVDFAMANIEARRVDAEKRSRGE